jgi:branched-chain amino acid transport system ATP-binding protein
MEKILEVINVTKMFGGLAALNSLSLTVQKGLMTLLIGPNGSGKTTLINVVAGLYKPESGTIRFEGENITGLTPHEIYRRGLVRTFQIPQPFTRLTVFENLMTARGSNRGENFALAPLRRMWMDDEENVAREAARIIKLIRLEHVWEQPAYKLSGGQMKLLEVGRALMSGARMLMMDEPAAGINPALAHELFTHLRELNKKTGVTFLLIEHRLDIALPYVDKVYAMHMGRLIAEGKPEEVLSNSLVVESYLGR